MRYDEGIVPYNQNQNTLNNPNIRRTDNPLRLSVYDFPFWKSQLCES